MQADEAGTLGILKARRSGILQPVVSRYHGRIVKLIGDGVLVEFGSVVNSVECAVQLQDAMAAASADSPEARWIVLRSEDLGERSLENIAELVQVYRVSGATPAALALRPARWSVPQSLHRRPSVPKDERQHAEAVV
jgi:hypothetical protein